MKRCATSDRLTQAMANREPWHDLVRALERALPDYDVTDRTTPYILEPAYVVELTPRDPSRKGMLVGMVSALAPVYFIGSNRATRSPGSLAPASTYSCVMPTSEPMI